MKQLSPSARRLFELARGQDEPDAVARNRVARALSAKIAAGVGLGATCASGSAVAAGIGAIAAKSALVVGVTGTLVAAGWLTLRSPRPAAPPVVAPGKTTRLVERAPTARSAEERSPVALPSEAVEERARAPIRRKPGRPSTDLESPTSAPAPLLGTPDELRAETEALRLAQWALRDGRSEQALRLLDDQDGRFRAGQLQQERAAARVLALCQAGQVGEARAQAIRFERLWPRSALLGRVRSACSVPK